MTTEIISQERLKQLVHYDPVTGVITNLVSRGNIPAGKVLDTVKPDGSRQYIQIKLDKRAYYAHRLAWLWVYGEHPHDVIDHIDGDTLNNSIANLRIGRIHNNRNKKIANTNDSPHCGVSWHKRDKVWGARISVDGSDIHLGNYKDVNNAIKARKEAEIRYGYSDRHGY